MIFYIFIEFIENEKLSERQYEELLSFCLSFSVIFIHFLSFVVFVVVFVRFQGMERGKVRGKEREK